MQHHDRRRADEEQLNEEDARSAHGARRIANSRGDCKPLLSSDCMLPKDVLGYVRQRERFWAERRKRMTPTEKLALVDDLRAYVKRRCPDWPSVEEREEDLAMHGRVSEMLRSVGPASSREIERL